MSSEIKDKAISLKSSGADLTRRLALRPKEAAEALGLSERKLREVLPQLPHVRLGGAVLLPVEGLQAWLREQAKVEQGRVEAVVDEILRSVEKHRT
jgi:excisionase family DNA binding protein